MSRSLALPFFVALLAAVPLAAQPADPDRSPLPPPVTLSYADGRVDIVRPDGVEAARVPDLLEDDDRLVVADGRAELVFDDGALVHVDRDTDLRIDADVRLRLVHGRVVIHTTPDTPLVVVTPAGQVTLDPRGTYDLTAGDLDADTTVAVLAGYATMRAGADEIAIPLGDELRLDPRDRRARWARVGYEDAFRAWSRSRASQPTSVSAAAPMLPPAVQPWAADFAVYGQWSSLPTYGAVWFPRVGPEWRPYAAGSWRYTRYGWTWIDNVRWGWPVHHYGRWGRHATRGWYWLPQRRWGPGWVSWAIAADHVAWSPLGWDARPVVDFFAGVRVGPVGVWANSWSMVPRHRFGNRGFGPADYQDPRRLPGPVLGGFVSQMIGPRGPAGADDRFAVRRSRRAPVDATVPRRLPPPIMYSPGDGRDTRDWRVVDPRVDPRGDDSPRRRPVDAPARENAGAGSSGGAGPWPGGARERVWSTTPPDPAPPDTERQRARPEGRAVAPQSRPRAERPEDPPATAPPPAHAPPAARGGSGRGDGRERANPAAAPRGGGAARPSAPPPASGGDGGATNGNRRRPSGDGAGAGTGRGDGAHGGATRAPGAARRRG